MSQEVWGLPWRWMRLNDDLHSATGFVNLRNLKKSHILWLFLWHFSSLKQDSNLPFWRLSIFWKNMKKISSIIFIPKCSQFFILQHCVLEGKTTQQQKNPICHQNGNTLVHSIQKTQVSENINSFDNSSFFGHDISLLLIDRIMKVTCKIVGISYTKIIP